MLRVCIFLLTSWWLLALPALGVPDPRGSDDGSNHGTLKYGDNCRENRECGFTGSYCDPRQKKCYCLEAYPATNNFDKCGETRNINESCFFNEQCDSEVTKFECRDGYCRCKFEKLAVNIGGNVDCIEEVKPPSDINNVDPKMIGILAGMALMFVIICVVLRLFSNARWRENRTIFNTPNTRLMNASLLTDNKLHGHERRSSRASMRGPSRQPSMASLRAHSPNTSQGAKHSQRVIRSRAGSRRGSRGSSGNASAVSNKSNKSPPNNHHQITVPENVSVEIFEAKT